MPRKDTDNTLAARWSKKHNDVVFEYPQRPDGRLLMYFFSVAKLGLDPEAKTLLDELAARGYDLKTLRFSIKRKKVITITPTAETA
jgi:hypothetical protein